MKLFKRVLSLLFIISVYSFASTSMCYKKNYSDITNIEEQIFSGGVCKNEFSISDMKKNGWSVEDIKITSHDDGTYDFVYILKYINTKNNTVDYALIAKKTDEYRVQQKAKDDYTLAIKKYKMHCVECHGKNGEIEAYGSSRKLHTLSKEEFIETMYDYKWGGNINRGSRLLMEPYAGFTDENINGYIYDYLMKQQNK